MDHLPEFARKDNQATYRHIANGLRDQILSGQLVPGQQLPTKKELSATWGASSFTIHTALQSLVKEGWIEVIHGAGTYVARSENRFACAGIYHGADLCSEEETPFTRRLHVALLEGFRKLEKSTLVFMDTRPPDEQTSVLPSLADAIFNRRIQCLVYPIVNSVNLPSLSRLNLPTATLGYPSPNMINFDSASLFREGMRLLARQGARSVGLIASISGDEAGRAPVNFYKLFTAAAKEEGLETREEWIRRPLDYVPILDLEKLGYTDFQQLWESPERPDALIVYPDTLARGVIMGILDKGHSLVTSKMKFLFHCNAHFRLFCPFPVAWAISDEDLVADGLIQQVQKQFNGEQPSPLLIPYQFESGPSLEIGPTNAG